jgi:hypothetical protein
MTHLAVKLDYFWIDEEGVSHCDCISCTENGLLINGLPVYVADDDFIEHLAEMGYSESIEEDDIHLEWVVWSKENVDEH